MNAKRMLDLAFATAMAIVVNVVLFGSLYLLVNP